MTTQKRKDEHIHINLEQSVSSGLTSGFEGIRFEHHALPEMDAQEIDTSVRILGAKLKLPLLISSMTGGTPEAGRINERLARAAETWGLGMALGSMRVLLEQPETLSSFDVRRFAPNIPLLWANIGAVQLNYGVTVDDCQRLVDLVHADGLILHLNPLQEMVQAEGDQNWSGLLSKIGRLTRAISVPVIAKEVGYGLSEKVAKQLIDAGVQVLDVAGAGGTSWSAVESHRAPTALHQKIAASFSHWGLTTYESLRAVRSVSDSIPLIASGGIDSGITAAKALHAGATLVGMAGPLLKPAATSGEALDEAIALFKAQLRTTMMCTGSKTCNDLKKSLL
jgi:isopentenyl-diphosphate delta-isomerase